jgi:hypothetical protein
MENYCLVANQLNKGNQEFRPRQSAELFHNARFAVRF